MSTTVEITPEMLEAARRKKMEDERLAATMGNEDPGAQNICIGCE
jgi:hypothetical protein